MHLNFLTNPNTIASLPFFRKKSACCNAQKMFFFYFKSIIEVKIRILEFSRNFEKRSLHLNGWVLMKTVIVLSILLKFVAKSTTVQLKHKLYDLHYGEHWNIPKQEAIIAVQTIMHNGDYSSPQASYEP